jgi:2-polyprenyl-3-methyl-5-hydroxy-6-metoxy-1,4-benzoquinol methylase
MTHDPLAKHYEQAFGSHADASRVDVSLRLLRKSFPFPQGATLRVLDIGGGDMQLSRLFANRMAEEFGVIVKLEGWDLSAEGVRLAGEAGEQSTVQSICEEIPSEAAGQYDLVLFFEVLEHLVDTDAAVINLRKLMKPDGWLLLSTPNLAGWIDRLSLLFGMQPHSMEVSFVPYRFGNPVIGRLLPHGPNDVAAGHLRVFTLRALKQFLKWHGIRPVQVGGCVNHSFDVVSRLFARWWPGMVGDVVVLGKPAEEVRLRRF